jgi:hypothetical protein
VDGAGDFAGTFYGPVDIKDASLVPGTLTVADTLSNRFPPHSIIPYGSIFVEIEYSEVGMSYPDDLYHCTPVTIGWFAHN